MIYGYDPEYDYIILNDDNGNFEFTATYDEFDEMMKKIRIIRERERNDKNIG